ncbi:MAG: hypothetical protein H6737_20060 [Alphaproteobacteria bacterium]|nr:hypothetical protein [Alphaproteobacteria bacterium]
MLSLFLLACAPEVPVSVEGPPAVVPDVPVMEPDPAPVLVDPRPVSFHAFDGDAASWDAIRYTYGFYGSTMPASAVRPEGLDPDDWAAIVDAGDDADLLAQTVDTLLLYERPHAVLIDGLTPETLDTVALAADLLAGSPHWRGRWGVRVPDSAVSYAELEPAFVALFEAGAIVLPELDAAADDYCAAASYPGGRDLWLSHRIRGEYGAPARMMWLLDLHTSMGSDSRIVPTLQVADRDAGILDRALYVWQTYSQLDALIEVEAGGPGSWVWGQEPERDDAFAASYVHYAVDGRVTALRGDVACP